MSTMTAQKHWKRPDQLQIRRESGWGYKYFRKDEVNKRLDEGWEVCHKNEKELKESGAVDSTQNYRSLILMRMPQNMIDERNQHYRDRHKKMLRQTARGSAVKSVTDRAATKDNRDAKSLAGAIGDGLNIKQRTVTEEGLQYSSEEHIPIHSKEDEEVELEKMEEEKSQKTASSSKTKRRK